MAPQDHRRCTIRRGETDDEDLRAAIGRRVVEDLGKTLRPAAVVVVPALPRTALGKLTDAKIAPTP